MASRIYTMKKILFLLFVLISITKVNGQSKYSILETKQDVSIKYKWKLSKENKKQLLIKFKNKSKVNQNINIEVGFYLNGVMQEKAQVATCAKKGFFNNIFLTVYGVESEMLTNEQIEDEQFKLTLTEFILEETPVCEKQHQ